MMRILLLLLLITPFSSAPPIGEKRPGEETPNDDEKRAKIDSTEADFKMESVKCHFKDIRKTDYEKEDRTEKSKVSTICSGKLIKLSELAKEPGVLNARNELELVEVRGEGLFEDFTNPVVIAQYHDKYICEGHRDELSTGWTKHDKYNHYFRNSAKQPTCSHRDHTGKRRAVKALLVPSSSVTLEESKATLKLEGFLMHVGTPVCATHKKHVQNLVSLMVEEETGQIIVPPFLDDNDNYVNEEDVDEEYMFDDSLVSSFRSFASAAGRLTGSTPFGELKRRTQQKKVCGLKRLTDIAFQITGKKDWKELRCQVFAPVMDVYSERKSSHKYADIMEVIGDRFFKSPTRREKELVISIIALKTPIHELRKYIPGLSQRLFNKAKEIAKVGTIPEREKFMRTRFNPLFLMYFINFILSPEVFADLPFGEKIVVASDGTKFSIPNSLRLHRASEIVHMYIESMKARKLEKFLFSRSTLFEILSFCSATQRKASVCVDYFYSDSELAFDDLTKATEFIVKNQIQPKEWKDDTDLKLKEYRFYLKGDFRLHTKNGSRVADHCWIHALSDPDSAQFSLSCSSPLLPNPHKHDLKCGRCEMGREVIGDIRDSLLDHQKELNGKTPRTAADDALLIELTDQLARVQEAEERIIDYKKHQLRGSITYKIREDTIDETEEGEAMITMDFGQKFLPMKFKEKQTDYFGKKGLSFHVCHIVTKLSGNMAQHSMVHIIMNDKQDSVAVTQIIRHLFEELMKVKITVVHLRSDNAGAYHSGPTLSSIHTIAKSTGMTVASYSFSESQNGKSAPDRVAGQVKNKVRAVVNSGVDAHNHETFFSTAVSGRLIPATSIYLVSVENTEVSKNKITKISDLNDYSFEKEGIRAWRHKNIGTGTFIKASSFKDKGNTGALKVEKKGGYYPAGDGTTPAGFWRVTPSSNTAVCQQRDGDDIPSLSDAGDSHIFHCPEATCSSSFSSMDELEDHVLRGDHCPAPLKYSLRDMALHMFSDGLEGMVSQRLVIPEVDEAVDEVLSTDQNDSPNVDQGYALKKKKPSSRYAEKAKVFVEKLFDEGITTGTKVTAEAAEKRMRAALNPDGSRMFTPEERLNARQIDSYYSRIKVERRDASVKRPKRATRASEGAGAWEDFDADEAVFEDAEFMSDADRIESTIMDNLDVFFDMNAEMEILHEELTAVSEPKVTIKSENKVFRLPPELCGKFGVLAEDQEKCWEERRIEAQAHSTVQAIGN